MNTGVDLASGESQTYISIAGLPIGMDGKEYELYSKAYADKQAIDVIRDRNLVEAFRLIDELKQRIIELENKMSDGK